MLQFEGTEDLPRPQAEVWLHLSDAGRLAEFVPDLAEVKAATVNEAVCLLRPSFGFMSGSLELTLRILERDPAGAARIGFHSKGVGASSDVEVRFRLEPLGENTRVHWVAEVKQLTGLLKLAPPGLVRGAAQKIVRDVWANVAAKLRT